SRRPASTRRRLRAHGVATEATRAVAPADQLRVRATNPIHQRLIVDEERYWARADFNAFFARAIEATREMGNRALTGRPDRDSLDDLGARGPFGRAALLGHEHGLGQRWMRTQPGTSTLDGVRSEPGRDRASAVAGRRPRRARPLPAHRPQLRALARRGLRRDLDDRHAPLHHQSRTRRHADRAGLRPGGLFALCGYV